MIIRSFSIKWEEGIAQNVLLNNYPINPISIYEKEIMSFLFIQMYITSNLFNLF